MLVVVFPFRAEWRTTFRLLPQARVLGATERPCAAPNSGRIGQGTPQVLVLVPQFLAVDSKHIREDEEG